MNEVFHEEGGYRHLTINQLEEGLGPLQKHYRDFSIKTITIKRNLGESNPSSTTILTRVGPIEERSWVNPETFLTERRLCDLWVVEFSYRYRSVSVLWIPVEDCRLCLPDSKTDYE